MLPTWAWTVLSIADALIVAATIVIILRRPREPRAMIAWILAVLLLPVLGPALFVVIGQPRLERTRRRRHRRRAKLLPAIAGRAERLHGVRATPEHARLDPALVDLARVALRLTAYPPTDGNEVTVFHDPESTFLAIQLAILGARSHVHLQYYILQPDETGRAVAKLLSDKARAGVRCRVLLDDVGCWRLPRSFTRSLRDAGVEVAFFHPVLPWRGRWHVNFRNHRKVVVVDGEVGFTGSQNIGDEYLGRRRKFAPWRDTHLRIIGPAAQDLQEVFLEDWHFTTGMELSGEECFPPLRRAGSDLVQIVPSGPDQEAEVLHQLLYAAVAAARRSVCIITPYFVPDSPMLMALKSAALRGVRVQLLIPSRTDHWFVLWAGRSYYEELSAAGIEIYEYEDGMLHSKTVVVDQSWALVGSANMDARSFRINFEVTTVLYNRERAAVLHEDFESVRARAKLVRPTNRRGWTFGESLSLGLARLASPLL
ncbi:MAG: cardiolipin synthase [Phycisphaerae bacterium]|nr:cardiolipin synthase [Phycisphaerae bacterium]